MKITISKIFRNQDGNIDKATKDVKLKEPREPYGRNMKEIESELSIFSNTKEYIELFQIKYEEVLKDYRDGVDKEYLYGLIHIIIEEIIVFSRPKRKTDSIWGPKKD